jgi:hypothetical protein
MLKIFFSLVMALLLHGTCLAGESGGVVYQPDQILAKGTQINDVDGLFRLIVTDDGYFMGKDAYTRGNYLVQTFPMSKISVETQKDLKKTFDWINEKVIAKRARKKAKISQTKERDFQGVKALYVESIFPGKTSKGLANLTVIHSYGFAYANIVFYNKGNLYWIYYSTPETDPMLIQEPKVKEESKQKFEEFLAGISLNP